MHVQVFLNILSLGGLFAIIVMRCNGIAQCTCAVHCFVFLLSFFIVAA